RFVGINTFDACCSFPRLKVYGLVFEKLIEPETPAFAAKAGLLETTEWSIHVGRRAIDTDLTCAQTPRHPLGILIRAGPDSAAQAIGRAIGDAYGVGLVLERNHREDRPEYFFLGYARCRIWYG